MGGRTTAIPVLSPQTTERGDWSRLPPVRHKKVQFRKRKSSRKRGYSQAEMIRKIADLTAEGWSKEQIAEKIGCSRVSVYRYRKMGRELEAESAQRRERVAEQAKDRLASLPQEVLDCLTDDPDGEERFFNRYSGLKMAAHTRKFVEASYLSPRVMLNVPPGYAKTTVFSIWRPIRRIAMNRDWRTIIVSATGELATQFAGEIAFHLEYNEKLIGDFGLFRPDTSATPWQPGRGALRVAGSTIKRGFNVLARGSNSQIMGLRCDELIADDVVDKDNTKTEERRQELLEWFTRICLSRPDPVTGRVTVIGHRLHLLDLYDSLSKQRRTESEEPLWTWINFPAILDWGTKESLWPERMPWSYLMEQHQLLGSNGFDVIYQQNPLSAGERLALPDWFYGTHDKPGCFDMDRIIDEQSRPAAGWVRVASLDPSPTAQAGLIVADISPRTEPFGAKILAIIRRRMNTEDMKNQLMRVQGTYGPIRYFLFESNSFKQWFSQETDFAYWCRSQGIEVREHHTSHNKNHELYGFKTLSADFEFGRIRLPYGDYQSIGDSKLIVDEATSWPQGRYDDLLMALWFTKLNHRTLMAKGQGSGMHTRFGVPPRLKEKVWARTAS